MMKFTVVSVILVLSSKQVQSGTLFGGGLGGYSGGGDDSYGGASLTGLTAGIHAIPAAPISVPDLGGVADLSGFDGAAAGLQQSGGDGGDFHGGVSIVGGGGPQQGQTLDLTGHVGGEHSGKIFGGSFISASVSGNSGSYASPDEAEGAGGYDIHSLAGGDGLGSYSGVSSYDVGHGGDSGEISSVLTSSYNGGDLGGIGDHFGGYH